jgi:hypothetical protein
MDEHEQIVITLTNMPNLISKRITPQRDMTRLTRAPERGEDSVRDVLAHLRDHEARYFPKLFLIATQEFPDLRRVERVGPTEYDPDDHPLTVMSQFRRLRQSTLSLLRELPRDAWSRAGVDVDNHTVTIKDLALELIDHDAEQLAHIDDILLARGAMPANVRPRVAVGR